MYARVHDKGKAPIGCTQLEETPVDGRLLQDASASATTSHKSEEFHLVERLHRRLIRFSLPVPPLHVTPSHSHSASVDSQLPLSIQSCSDIARNRVANVYRCMILHFRSLCLRQSTGRLRFLVRYMKMPDFHSRKTVMLLIQPEGHYCICINGCRFLQASMVPFGTFVSLEEHRPCQTTLDNTRGFANI